MNNVKRNYTTVSNWVKTMENLCGFNISFKISVYNTASFERDKCCFKVAAGSKDIVDHFGEYFVYYVKTGDYDKGIELIVCKDRPDEKYWTEYMKGE